MKPIQKLQEIAPQMELEPAEEVGKGLTLGVKQPTIAPCGIPLHQSKKHESLGVVNYNEPGRRQPMKLLKTMLTTACERDCHYCPFRAGRNYKRTSFKPDEMADTFMALEKSGAANGIFLSSGILKGGVMTQDKLLDTIEILRKKHAYRRNSKEAKGQRGKESNLSSSHLCFFAPLLQSVDLSNVCDIVTPSFLLPNS